MWTPIGLIKIKELKKAILKKKIMLNFLVDVYSWWDKAYRYVQLLIAIGTPIFGLIELLLTGSDGTVSIVLSCVVAAMIKFKDHIMYDKIRDTAKEQTIKYTQLFERIERELIKPDAKKQSEDDFIYWINREYTNLELNDPELSFSDKKKFIELCKSKGIPIEEDLTVLLELLSSTTDTNNLNTNHIDNLNTDKITNNDNSKSIIQSVSEEEKTEYKDKVANMNAKADFVWTMERLDNIN